jgi:TPP-dependent pyruvate/acetoin dehydrogenase alpha subunit
MTRAQKTERPPDGSLSSHNGFSLISNEKLLEIYSTMLKCRMLDERIRALHKQAGNAEIGLGNSIHVAAITGAAIDLLPGDTLAPSQGAFAPCFAKGLPLNAILPSILGRRNAPRPRYSALKLVPPLLSESKQLERVLEAAKICKAKRNKNVVIAFSSNSCGAETEFESALMMAGKKKLPILFVREISSGADERGQRMKEYGFPGVAVEYDDAIAVYRVATEGLAHARRGNGPTLIECKPWPFDDRGSGKRALTKHSISKMETYLAGKGLFSRKFKTTLIADFNGELDAAINAAFS